jgi:hypothetical protein
METFSLACGYLGQVIGASSLLMWFGFFAIAIPSSIVNTAGRQTKSSTQTDHQNPKTTKDIPKREREGERPEDGEAD